ncbi:hypothetical protein DdX_21766 [Ditylenchus destructor]|uniref:Uncharacterized protein n=1 Tax=Ditylenchus destructor TaxID=166010 RepID=A0AAD4QSV4_9BILA|nr:hypothetical protein DdX_21766 [Ditylenchus destructor]
MPLSPTLQTLFGLADNELAPQHDLDLTAVDSMPSSNRGGEPYYRIGKCEMYGLSITHFERDQTWIGSLPHGRQESTPGEWKVVYRGHKATEIGRNLREGIDYSDGNEGPGVYATDCPLTALGYALFNAHGANDITINGEHFVTVVKCRANWNPSHVVKQAGIAGSVGHNEGKYFLLPNEKDIRIYSILLFRRETAIELISPIRPYPYIK